MRHPFLNQVLKPAFTRSERIWITVQLARDLWPTGLETAPTGLYVRS